MSGQTNESRVAWLPEIVRQSTSGTLVVGDLRRWTAEGRAFAGLSEFNFTNISRLDRDLINDLDPDIVLSPLVADEFDAVDVAVKLIDLNYRGKYRAITDQHINGPLIANEIRSLSPHLDFDLLQLGSPPPAASNS